MSSSLPARTRPSSDRGTFALRCRENRLLLRPAKRGASRVAVSPLSGTKRSSGEFPSANRPVGPGLARRRFAVTLAADTATMSGPAPKGTQAASIPFAAERYSSSRCSSTGSGSTPDSPRLRPSATLSSESPRSASRHEIMVEASATESPAPLRSPRARNGRPAASRSNPLRFERTPPPLLPS